MAVVIVLAIAMLGACYAPDLTDCASTCSTNDDCGPGQTCHAGACAAPGVSCTEEGPEPEPQPARSALRVEIEGEGAIAATGLGNCSNEEPDHACMYIVKNGTSVELVATETGDKHFEQWTSAACMGQDATCTVVVRAAITVRAKFH